MFKYNSGGLVDLELLYDTEILESDFKALKMEFLHGRLIELNEGWFHFGETGIIRMIARKHLSEHAKK